jgi:hypothetical protein
MCECRCRQRFSENQVVPVTEVIGVTESDGQFMTWELRFPKRLSTFYKVEKLGSASSRRGQASHQRPAFVGLNDDLPVPQGKLSRPNQPHVLSTCAGVPLASGIAIGLTPPQGAWNRNSRLPPVMIMSKDTTFVGRRTHDWPMVDSLGVFDRFASLRESQ